MHLEKEVTDLGVWLDEQKKKKLEFEREKRRLDTEIAKTREHIQNLENERARMEGRLKKCEVDFQTINAKYEEQASTALQYQKQLKLLQQRREELIEQLENEQSDKKKALDLKANVADELKDLTKRLNIATNKMKEQDRVSAIFFENF